MTHQSVEGSAAAVPADLVRLSCGIEASVDLIADLAQALDALSSALERVRVVEVAPGDADDGPARAL